MYVARSLGQDDVAATCMVLRIVIGAAFPIHHHAKQYPLENSASYNYLLKSYFCSNHGRFRHWPKQ